MIDVCAMARMCVTCANDRSTTVSCGRVTVLSPE